MKRIFSALFLLFVVTACKNPGAVGGIVDDLPKVGGIVDDLPKMGGVVDEAPKIANTLDQTVSEISTVMISSNEDMVTRLQQRNVLLSRDQLNRLNDSMMDIACEITTKATDGSIETYKEIAQYYTAANGINLEEFPEILNAALGVNQQLLAIQNAKGIPGYFRDGLLVYCAARDLP